MTDEEIAIVFEKIMEEVTRVLEERPNFEFASTFQYNGVNYRFTLENINKLSEVLQN